MFKAGIFFSMCIFLVVIVIAIVYLITGLFLSDEERLKK
jgi:hypothetical protein